MNDYSSFAFRNKILGEIDSNENKARKRESLRRFEIYKGRLEDYVLDLMAKDTDPKDIENMRVITSINMAKRITDKRASVYQKTPIREFEGLNDKQIEQIEAVYKAGKFNPMLKKCNWIYDLEDQCILQVYPKNGIIKLKPMMPHHCDVVPRHDDSEEMEAVILTSFDKDSLFNKVDNTYQNPSVSGVDGQVRDNVNQTIADQDDFKSGADIAVWWTDTHHFITDKSGTLLDPVTHEEVSNENFDSMVNPIEQLPFIDIAKDKDFEFWNRYANSTVDFSVQFSVMLSDAAEIIRMQGYAQPIISSLQPPESLPIGPRKAIWFPKIKGQDAAMQPEFKFASPSPDIAGTLEFLTQCLNLHLTSEGLDTGTVTTESGAERYSSGLERMLALVEQFQASEDDIELFKWVEAQVFKLTKKWLDIKSDELEPELGGTLPDDSIMSVTHKGPEVTPSAQETEESIQRRLDNGLMTKVEAIMEDRDISKEAAEIVKKEIDKDSGFDLLTEPQELDVNE